QYRHRIGQSIAGEVMVADNEIDASLAGIVHFVQRLDAAIQCDNQRKPIFRSVVNPLSGNTISFGISIGQIKLQARVELPEKTIDNGYSGRSIHIIITINKYLFLIAYSVFNTCNSLVHVFHQERIMQQRQIRTEKTAGVFKAIDSSIYQQLGQYPVNTKLFAQFPCRAFIMAGSDCPSFLHIFVHYERVKIKTCKHIPYSKVHFPSILPKNSSPLIRPKTAKKTDRVRYSSMSTRF